MKFPSLSRSLRQPLLCLSFLLLLPASAPSAHEGHDDEAKPAAASPAAQGLPQRFSLSSAHYELVGVLSGQELTLYLDHADDNRPVQGAQLSLSIGGQMLKPEAHGEAGEFELALAAPLKPGSLDLSAVVQLEGRSEQLQGKLELLPQQAAADEAQAKPRARLWWAAALLGSLALALLAWRSARRVGAGKAGAAA